MSLKWLPFFLLAHFSWNMKHTISMRWLANPHEGLGHFPHEFWSSNEHLIKYQSEYSHAHQMVKQVSPPTPPPILFYFIFKK